ncbi:hypothetical protein A6770_18500 [Nostoc minutum NIES-26]|uniref:Uncharacterized protein n=1 Tax=Nostoc minutum NIES-26 TaxID=1844469 RepID=A0A367RBL3_9NOSO|nr:hypothetical protein A6770_18500 [Nostoc minutum NIES-26]
MKFLVFISTQSGEQHWKGQADSLHQAEEKALTSIDAHSKTISDTSICCQWHWQYNPELGDTEHCNTCGNPVYWVDEEYYCSYCVEVLRRVEADGQLYSR